MIQEPALATCVRPGDKRVTRWSPVASWQHRSCHAPLENHSVGHGELRSRVVIEHPPAAATVAVTGRPGVLPDRAIRVLLVDRVGPWHDRRCAWVIIEHHPAGTTAPVTGCPRVLPYRMIQVLLVQIAASENS